MLNKNINTLIERVKDYIDALNIIDPQDYKHMYLAGGAIVNWMQNESHLIKDYDVYFTSKEIADKYRDRLVVDDRFFRGKFSYTDIENHVSFIVDVCGNPEDVIADFDFEHCKVYSFIENPELMATYRSIRHLENKTLAVCKINYPTLTLMRAIKLINRGWSIDNSNWWKICDEASRVDSEQVIAHIKKCNS